MTMENPEAYILSIWLELISPMQHCLSVDMFVAICGLGEVIEMANRFNWVEIRVRDLEKARGFYGNLFDWKIKGDENKDWAYWLIDTGEKPDGGMWRFPQGKQLGVLVYISVDDIDQTLKRVVELGGKIVAPKSKEGENAMATIADLDGNLFGLHQSARK
jgi:predicted enzyme related to lactoylglutathione lyase